MESYHYLSLPNCTRVPLYKERKGRKPKFYPQFIKLWELLCNVGEGGLPVFSGVVTQFPVPNNLISTLVGKPDVTDPTSIVRVYTFKNIYTDGPVKNSGYQLDLYSNEVDYKISWRANRKHKNFLVGFYRSNSEIGSETNSLVLICGNRGASLFSESSGSFKCRNIDNLCVATNKNVDLELEVEVIIPDELVYPIITREQPYTKLITVRDRNGETFRLPAYEIFVTGPRDSPITVKRPSKYFTDAAKAITDYLASTGLSITLLPDSEPISNGIVKRNNILSRRVLNNSIQPNQTCYNCETICGEGVILQAQYWPTSSVSTITDNICEDQRAQYYNRRPYGMKLNTPQGKVPRIKYRINTNTSNIDSYKATIGLMYLDGGSMPKYHDKLNNRGNSDGSTKTEIQVISPDQGIFEREFRISQTADSFYITVYYYITTGSSPQSKNEAYTKLLNNTTFEEISITYEDKVLQ